MSSFYELSSYEFETLSIPDAAWRLDVLAQSNQQKTNSKTFSFETEESCWAEDDRRATALRQFAMFHRPLYDGLKGCNPEATADLLSEGLAHKWLRPCAASAAYMRDRHLAVLGSILKLVHNHPKRNLGFVKITHPAWYLTLRQHWNYPSCIWEDTFDLIEKGGVFDVGGFMVGVMTGHYCPSAGNIQLILRAICGGDKVKQFINMRDREDMPQMFEWGVYDAVNLPTQLSAMMPNRITELPEFWRGETQARRMRQPYHNIYLMWLAGFSFARLIMMHGVGIDKERGMIIET